MLSLSTPIKAKLSILRDLDHKVDFARSTLQLQILFALLVSSKPLTPTEISRLLEVRRKAVLDALRKLEIKKLVKKTGSVGMEYLYELGEEGRDYADKLMSILGINGSTIKSEISSAMDSIREALLRRIVESHHIYNAIVMLANSENNMLKLSKLAELMGLSTERAKSYLDLFSRPPYRVFRRVRVNGELYYKLEDKGLYIYKRTPVYCKTKNSFIYRCRLKLKLLLGRWGERAKIIPIALAIASAASIAVALFNVYLAFAIAVSSMITISLASILLP